jgi:hypothetical protein
VLVGIPGKARGPSGGLALAEETGSGLWVIATRPEEPVGGLPYGLSTEGFPDGSPTTSRGTRGAHSRRSRR